MKLTKQVLRSEEAEIDLPEYFTSLSTWVHKATKTQLISVLDSCVQVQNNANLLQHIDKYIKPCEPEIFYKVLAERLKMLRQVSGIELLPLIDNTSNPES